MKRNSFLIFLIFGSFSLFAQEFKSDSLTPNSIADEIVRNNLGLKSLSENNKAEILKQKAENIIGPTSIEYSPFFRSGVTGLASSELIVKQEFDFPTLYHNRSKSASLKEISLNAELKNEERNLRIETINLCIDLISEKNQLNLLNQRLALTDSLISLYEEKLQLRSVTLLDVNRLKLTRQDIVREIGEARIELSGIETSLIGLNCGKKIDLERLTFDTPLEEISLPESAKEYAEHVPSVIASRAETRVTENELKIAKMSWLPTIGVGYRRNTEGKEASNGFIIGLDFPIFSIGARTKAAKASRAAAEIAESEADNSAITQAETAIAKMHGLRTTLESYDLSLINRTLELYKTELSLGSITLPDYLRETDLLFDCLSTRGRLEQEYRRLATPFLIRSSY